MSTERQTSEKPRRGDEETALNSEQPARTKPAQAPATPPSSGGAPPKPSD